MTLGYNRLFRLYGGPTEKIILQTDATEACFSFKAKCSIVPQKLKSPFQNTLFVLASQAWSEEAL